MEQMMTEVYWGTVHFRTWTFYLAATSKGLCSLMLPNASFEAMHNWIIKHIPNAQLTENPEYVRSYTQQLLEYLQGERKTFDVMLDMRGTPFQLSVWNALMRIPYGKTCSYAQIAEEIHKPKAVRAVGAANGANPVPIIVPCHRVIGKDGTLTGYGGGLDVKEELLRLEGFSI
jgi:methylated-DNA-[protein]-cysteine S-methyltransferase